MVTNEEYAAMSAAVYGAAPGNRLVVEGWTADEVGLPPWLFLGFKYGIYTRGTGSEREIVIAYAGTDRGFNPDLLSGFFGVSGQPLPSQLTQAAVVYAMVRRDFPGVPAENISFTGHSLGGGLASVMAVWFDHPATVFAPAPFEYSAQGSAAEWTADLARFALLITPGLQNADDLLVFDPDRDFAAREANVTSLSITGEVLERFLSWLPTIEGTAHEIDLGDSPLSPFQRHGIDLHAATIMDEDFRRALAGLPAAGPLLFDESLYAASIDDDQRRDFLRMLLQRHADGALHGFALDLQALGGTGRPEALTEGLVAAVMDRYMLAPAGEVAPVATPVAGGVHLALPASDAPGGQRLASALAEQMEGDDRYAVLEWLPSTTDWYVASDGATPLQLIAGSRNDVLIGSPVGDSLDGGAGRDLLWGGSGDDQLAGGDDDDLLIGGSGADVLDGAAGNDCLSGGPGDDRLIAGPGLDILDGGVGTDTYVVTDGYGNAAAIHDADGLGSIQVLGTAGTQVLSGDLTPIPGTAGAWLSTAGDRWSLAGPNLDIRLVGGGRIQVADFESGELGFELPGPAVAQPPGPPAGAALYFADGDGPHNGLVWGGWYQTWYESPALRDAALIGAEDIDISAAPPAEGLISIGAYGGVGDSRISGGPWNDYLFDDRYYDGTRWVNVIGIAGRDTLIGNGGDDWLEASAGDDVLFGGDGNDILLDSGRGSEDAGFGDVSWVRIPGNSSNDRLYGEGGDDVLSGEAGDGFFDGGDGADELYGGPDDDLLFGGPGNDVLGGDSRLDAPLGTNLLNVGLDPVHSFSGQWIEDVDHPGRDLLEGGDGDDILLGGGGDDLLGGGAGNDRLQGDTLFVPAGTRALQANHGTTPIALHGNDLLSGDAGADTLYGGGGDDRLDGDDDDDVLFGDDHPGRTGSPALADPGNDLLDGGTGNDSLYGNGGNDRLVGGAGDDELYAGRGDDRLDGGAGADYLVGDDVSDDDPLNAGRDILHGGDDADLLFGLGGDDRLYGDAGDDQLVGGAGNDLLEGGEGDDWLFGEEGNDTLRGGPGQDQLQGGDGDDVLEAGTGDLLAGGDRLFGDGGNDRFELNAGAGNVQISDTAGDNQLVFGAGVEPEQVRVSMSNGIVFVDYSATDYAFMDTPTFEHLAALGFADGSALAAAQLRERFAPGAVVDGQLALAEGVTAAEVGCFRRGDDLLLTYAGDVADWCNVSTLGPRNILFERRDGSELGLDAGTQILVLTNWYRAEPSTYLREFGDWQGFRQDFTAAAAAADRLVAGGAGPDFLIGSAGTDLLVGGGAADTLDAGAGDDRLAGGTGDDILSGGAGDDLYTISTGDGLDVIVDAAGAQDVVRFGAGIAAAALTVTESPAGLVVRIGPEDAGNALLLADWSLGSERSIDRFDFTDGTSLDRDQVDALNTGNHSPRMVAAVAEQLAGVGQPFNWTVPPDVFADQDAGDSLSWSAGNADGAALPGWLSFDPATRRFTGTPRAGDAGTVPVRLQVTDTGGLSSNLDLTIRVTAAIVVTGTMGGDTLSAASGADHELYGLAGNDVLTGNAGDDRLVGGAGNDRLDGAGGDDTYLYQRGDGSDTIAHNDPSVNKLDTLLFGSGILPEDLVFGSEPDGDLVIRVRNADGSLAAEPAITVAGGLVGESSARRIDRITWSDDPAVLGLADIERLAMVPTEGDDYLRGSSAADDSLDGRGGDDVLLGLGGADLLHGQDGSDFLQGGDGDDLLEGGAGRDQLNGEAGNDTCRFGRGQGYDEIIDSAGSNRIELDTGIAAGNVTLYRTSSVGTLSSSQEATTFDDLVLVLDGGREQIRVEGFYNGQVQRPLDEIAFADGSRWLGPDIDARVVNLGGAANTQTGRSRNDTFTVDHPDDVIVENAGGGFDTVNSRVTWTLPANVENLTLTGPFHIDGYGNADGNTLTGNALDNTLQGFGGTDTLYGGAGNDTFPFMDDGAWDRLYGGAGDDVYYIGTESVNPFTTPNDEVWENPDEGYDTVHVAAFAYTLPANVEAAIFHDVPGTYSGSFTQLQLTGNALDNLIDAREADRQLTARFVIDGGAGADTMYAVNGGVNRILVDHSGDAVIGADADDTIVASIDYLLPAGAGQLELRGAADIAGTGNALANRLDGSTSTGANRLTGGAGDDVYLLGAGDTVVEQPGGGNDTVQVAFVGAAGHAHSLADYAEVENLTATAAAGAASLGGSAADNVLTGNAADNILDGGAGNDTLVGQAGNDCYAGFGIASGHDRIVDSGGTDSLVMDPLTVAQVSQLSFSRSAADLLIAAGTDGSVRIEGWFADPDGSNAIESLVVRRDGMTWAYTAAQIEARVSGDNGAPARNAPLADQALDTGVTWSLQLPANQFSDIESQDALRWSATLADGSPLPPWLSFDPQNRMLGGIAGAADRGIVEIRVTVTDQGGLSATDDFLLDVGRVGSFGTDGDDVLSGTDGIDWIDGLAGDDVLTGGAGADRLSGGTGSDRYVFAAGSGADTVIEAGGWDRIEFTAASGIELADLAATRAGDDLHLDFAGGSLTLLGQFADSGQRIDEVVTWAGGLPWSWSSAQIEALATGQNTAPYAATPPDHRATRANVSWTYSLPANLFADTQSQDQLVLSARLTGGAPLPSWLSFNPASRSFSGKAPKNMSADFGIEVLATDPAGLSAATTFTLHVRRSLANWSGTAAADAVAGTTGADYQLGLAGDDLLHGNAGDDIQDGGEGADVLRGQAGNDIGYGGPGNDLLEGGDGSDTLSGDAGRDILSGGPGSDLLRGGAGADVYRFAAGDGADHIDNTTVDLEPDLLEFTSLNRAQLSFSRSGADLLIARPGTADSVRVASWFSAPGNRLDEIVTADGLRTSADEIDTLIAGGGAVFGGAADAPVAEDQTLRLLVQSIASFSAPDVAEAPANEDPRWQRWFDAAIFSPRSEAVFHLR
ncbi:MAG: hypothetical protein FJ191_04350 [Gammaproteobacteria bacterium]|nr:hypothetical protein [Gammaproteobacteria bacterium]